jgi:hypothetical protein
MYNLKFIFIFNIISLKTNTFIPAMLQRYYPVPVVVLRKIYKILLYSCHRLLIRRKTLTSEEEFVFWEEIEVRGSQIWKIDMYDALSSGKYFSVFRKFHFRGLSSPR